MQAVLRIPADKRPRSGRVGDVIAMLCQESRDPVEQILLLHREGGRDLPLGVLHVRVEAGENPPASLRHRLPGTGQTARGDVRVGQVPQPLGAGRLSQVQRTGDPVGAQPAGHLDLRGQPFRQHLAVASDALGEKRRRLENSLVQYARQHLNETDNPSVRIALERALTLDQANWLAHAWLGDILRRNGEFTQARVHLDLAADAMPNSAWVAGTRGQVLYALDQPEALDELRRAADLDVNGSLPWLHAQLGDAYRLARRYHEALAELDRATKLAPGDAWAWALTGATQSLLADWEKARSSLDKAIRLDPGCAWALAVKASLLAKIDEADDALHTICAALDADPKIYWAWGLKSSLLDRLDADAAEQEQAARNGLQLQPDDIFLLISLAEALLRKRRGDAAESCFRAVVDSVAASSELRVDDLQHIAWCHLRLHHYDQAVDCLSELLAKNYKISAGYDLGLVLLCAGRQGVALDEYEEGAARTRSEPHAGRRRNLARVARHDLERMLEDGQIEPGLDVEKVKQVLDQMLLADAATDA